VQGDSADFERLHRRLAWKEAGETTYDPVERKRLAEAIYWKRGAEDLAKVRGLHHEGLLGPNVVRDLAASTQLGLFRPPQ